MTEFEVFKIPKATGTHSDVFAAVGLASLLSSVGPQAIQLTERESEFEIVVPGSLCEANLNRIPQSPGYLYLRPNAKSPVPRGIPDYVDYPRELERVERYRKQRETLRRKGTSRAEIDDLLKDDLPRDDWELWRALNNLQGDETSNRIYLEIVATDEAFFRAALKAGFSSIRTKSNSGLKWNITQSMLFSPTSAKGYRELKPAGTKRKNFKIDEWADPFVEWLKYRGYFRVAIPRLLGKDVRLLVPIPCQLSLLALESTVRELRKGGVYGGPPKMDSLAVLRLAELLIRHSEDYHDSGAEVFPGLTLSGRTPAEAISGVVATHYQSLGSAKAVMEMLVIALPGWFPIRHHADSESWLAILDEHQRIVRGLQDDRSDEIGLLIAYRCFLQKRGEAALWALIEFMEKYGALVMRVNGLRQENRARWMTRASCEHFRRIVMGTDSRLMDIVSDPGFESVARAVRQSTVTAQNKKARGGNLWREIRYELLHDIHRTRKVPGDAFVECISEFVSRYNYENARQRETTNDPKAAPANVTDGEMKAFLTLVDRHGGSVVGALLAAYGSCKEKWEAEDESQHATRENEDRAEAV